MSRTLPTLHASRATSAPWQRANSLRSLATTSVAVSFLVLGGVAAAQGGEPISPLPLTAHVDKARAALGGRLFHDARLSRSNQQSCATCHPIDRGAVDGVQRAMLGSPQLKRDTPTLFNINLNIAFNWDGSGRSLETVTDGVIRSKLRFDTTWEQILEKLGADKSYVADFKSAYAEGLTVDTARDALVQYQRSLTTPNARFDRHLRGEPGAITAAELEGYPFLTIVVLSSAADSDTIVKLINQAHIYRFAMKPISPNVFRLAVHAAMREHHRMLADPTLAIQHLDVDPENPEMISNIVHSLSRFTKIW